MRFGTVVVAARAESGQLDWELVAQLPGEQPLDRGTIALEMTVVAGADGEGGVLLADWAGAAVLVRVAEDTHVLRGTTGLDGFDISLLGG